MTLSIARQIRKTAPQQHTGYTRLLSRSRNSEDNSPHTMIVIAAYLAADTAQIRSDIACVTVVRISKDNRGQP